jgi:hypothetical protein
VVLARRFEAIQENIAQWLSKRVTQHAQAQSDKDIGGD